MPIATPEQKRLRTTYCNLMEEIKLRVFIAGKALNGEYNLPDLPALEFSALQLRLICETISLASLVAHGDDPRAKTNKMKDAYHADWILNALESMHADFYPIAGSTYIEHANGHLEFINYEFDPLPKAELLRIYRKCDEYLHAGDFGSLDNRHEGELNFKLVEDALPKIAGLLKFHKIKLVAPEEELWVWMGGDEPIRAKLIAPVENYLFESVSPRAGRD